MKVDTDRMHIKSLGRGKLPTYCLLPLIGGLSSVVVDGFPRMCSHQKKTKDDGHQGWDLPPLIGILSSTTPEPANSFVQERNFEKARPSHEDPGELRCGTGYLDDGPWQSGTS